MIINKRGEKTPLLFVHIPKTAGMAVRHHLNNLGQDSWVRTWMWGHDPYQVLKQNNNIDQTVYKFAVVRNPFDRAYSYYRFLTKLHPEWKISFNSWLDIPENSGRLTEVNTLSAYDQSFFIYQDNKTELDKIYRYENLQELEEDLNFSLKKINIGSYTKEEYYNEYTPEIIGRVRKIYSRDFKNLGYSDEFT
jgi:hypothetical protein